MYKIVCDSAGDILKEYFDKHDVTMVPLYVTFDGETYHKEQVDVDHNEFYKKMIEDGLFPKSSLPSVQDFIDAFLPSVEAGVPIICICITTFFSGSYNSACTAKELVLEDHPDAKITVINSMQNSASEGLYIYEAIRMKEDGVSYEDTIDVLEKLKPYGRIFFTIESLDYLKKNGRIGKLAILVSGKLKIKPLIVMKDGEISVGGISRTRKKAKSSVIELAKKHFSDGKHNIEDYDFIVESGYDFEERDEFRAEVESELGIKCIESKEDFPTVIGVVTACHTGPYALGIGAMPKYESLLKK